MNAAEETQVVIYTEEGPKTVPARVNETVLALLNRAGVLVYSPCGGDGRCGKCRVRVRGIVNGATNEEQATLTAGELAGGIRLACRTYILGETAIYPDTASVADHKGLLGGQVVYRLDPSIRQMNVELNPPSLARGDSTFDRLRTVCGDITVSCELLGRFAQRVDYSKPVTLTLFDRELIDFAYGSPTAIYGVAVDVGTTTLVCYLLDLTNGQQLAVSSCQNPQTGYGADVISRIRYTMQIPNGLAELRASILAAVNGLIQQAAGKAAIDRQFIYHCVLVGNTTMNHIFWGLNCKSLAGIPFNAVTTDTITVSASEAGLEAMNDGGKVTWLPGIAGYVGADTVGAMLAAGLEKRSKNVLLIDLGTNGEIVLATPGGLYVCSTAAGPAFEGARIQHGMQAFAGAIARVQITDDVHYSTIDHALPKGICGSALIDLIGEMVRIGVIAANGRIVEPARLKDKKLAARIRPNGRSRDFIIAFGEETANGDAIVLGQRDIRELQLAKGAIRAGINILLRVAGIPSTAVDQILLAGAFGNFVDADSALRIGLFPRIAVDKVVSIGNAAGSGAKMALLDRDLLWRTAKELAAAACHVEISTQPGFQDEFVDGMYLG